MICYVFISIDGVDRNPYYPYFRVKLDTESVVERSPVPWTILRATQFYELILRMLRLLDRLPVMLIPKGFRFQPIDAEEVAERLVELTLSSPAGRVPDVGGPEVLTSAELARTYLEAIGRKKRLVELPLPGRAARAWREGAQLYRGQAYGKIRWEQFLRETLHQPRVDETVRAS
jgi:uncharacterized protein YbjT (DUF2867 family)